MTPLQTRQIELTRCIMAGSQARGIPGWPLVSACASAGNSTQENLCRPVTPGKHDHGSDGLFQWRLDRLQNMKTWTSHAGLSWGTIQAQALFYMHEMMTEYHHLYTELLTGTKPLEVLTSDICMFYERPAAAAADMPRRIKYARQILALMESHQ